MRTLLTLLWTLTASLSAQFTPEIPLQVHRPFISGDFWTNPAEDWELKDGQVHNTHSGGDRNVVLLTATLDPTQSFQITLNVDRTTPNSPEGGFTGLLLGLQGTQNDYRDDAVYGAGLPLGLTHSGHLIIADQISSDPALPPGPSRLTVTGKADPQSPLIVLTLLLTSDSEVRQHRLSVHPSWLRGLISFSCSTADIPELKVDEPRPPSIAGGVNFGRRKASESQFSFPHPHRRRGGKARASFSNLHLKGPGVSTHPDRHFGPILWATYTVTPDGQLRLLAQMAPVTGRVTLNLSGQRSHAEIDPISHTALFQLPLLAPERDTYFSLHYGKDIECGLITALPTVRQELTLAALSCNDSTGFPHCLLVQNVASHQPDVLTFHGDQIYEGIGDYGHLINQEADRRADLCYLRKYALHGWTWKSLLMTRPSVTIPDDHDVFHGNIWGAGGKLTPRKGDTPTRQDAGGYKMSPRFVNLVHLTQTGNLPLPADQATAQNGISTYFTSWRFGAADFVILADRQFKSAPSPLFPEAEIHNGWPQNLEWDPVTQSHHPDAQLLGPLQEEFLEKWAARPAPFKIALSQSPFLAPQTLPRDMHHDRDVPSLPIYPPGGYAPDDEPKADFDTNAWPQNRQKLALRLLQKAEALHIVGDQHLGTTGQYGIETFDDGPWWIATPATANVWPRRWMPAAAPEVPHPSGQRHLGGFRDGFGNHFTLHAVANPHDLPDEPARLHDRAVGYTTVHLEPNSRKLTLTNWPYLQGKSGTPYPGWPVIVTP